MHILRRLLPVVLLLALVGASCAEAEQTAEDVGDEAEDVAGEVAEEAEDVAESVDFTGSFELTGEVTDASLGETPDVDVPGISEDAPSEEARQPEDPGLLDVEVSSTDESLVNDCGTEEGDGADVFWTNDTYFDPADVLEDGTFPENMEGRTITASGNYATVDVDVGNEDPDENPCLLIASVIEVGEASA